MLPLQQAYEVREAVLAYIKATFRFKEPQLRAAFNSFISDKRDGLFKGPYINMKTPFVSSDENVELPLDIVPPFNPHLHQLKSFQRLTTKDGHEPKPTLLTTGTGSGKTECFLYPILDYIYQLSKEEKKPGVKVIIMYPMNALATDQATRLAEAISDDSRLKDKITAGLFLGMGTNIDCKGKVYPKKMGPSNIIEDRKSIVDSVPDILLTNFKMLDYALMKQDFMPIWKGNIDEENPALKFIVLDELHTYDGAQGTDMANLLRRLKLKLKIPKGKLIPVGTSATIGSGPDSKEDLCSYASDIFGEEILPDAIIEEDRVDVKDFFNLDVDSSDARSQYQNQLPSVENLKRFSDLRFNSTESYITGACKLWFKKDISNSEELGLRLKKSKFLYDILSITSKHIISLDDLIHSMAKLIGDYYNYSPEEVKLMVETIIALVSKAKTSIGNGILTPFLTVQVQLWQRELSGIRRYVSQTPRFTWLDSITDDDCVALPMYFCRECGESGWLTSKKATEDSYSVDDKSILTSFLHGGTDIRFMTIDDKSVNYPSQDYLSKDSLVETNKVDVSTLEINNHPFNDAIVLDVKTVFRAITKKDRAPRLDFTCPSCVSTNNELAIIGGRTSTLSSVAVSQVMSSDFNTESKNGAQRKLLVFSNSVQDAAHLAGFYEMRTYRFLFRQSIHHYLMHLKHMDATPVSLQELLIGFKKYWKQLGENYYYRFIPDDLVLKIDLSKNYRDSDGNFSRRFKEEFDHRIDWEICSEFGLMSQRGRTLEKMGSSATLFSRTDLSNVYHELEPWLKDNNLGHLANEECFLHFFNGMLHRLRKHGGIDHVYLDALRENDFTEYNYNWYKHLSKKHFLNRKGGRASRAHLYVYEQAGKEAKNYTDNVCSDGNMRNWYYRYFIKSVIEPTNTAITPNPDAIDDMMKMVLDLFVKAEILNKKTTTPKKQFPNGIDNYAINPQKLYVEPSVQHIKCDKCEEIMYVAKSDSLTKGMNCLSYLCDSGVYNKNIPIEDNYYKRIYNRKNSPRIYTHEHTGLLDRKEREKVESIFKNGVDLDGNIVPEAFNVLTATSTLEMGIDIGNLNVVSNVSIPPTPSNFLQRIGRAGRKEGSALVLNYAKKSSHDQYYFAEPMLIMDGQIATPGCFLEAKDILKRHFYAYCIDTWITSNSENRLPARIKELCLTLPSFVPDKLFINVIKSYILKNKKGLIENFRKYYPDRVQPVISKLATMLDDRSFFEIIENAFWRLKNELISLNDEIDKVRDEIEEIPENDMEKKTATTEHLKSLYWKLKSINKELVLEFMTNAGLLPNYAFPETGVKLYATVFSSIAPEDSLENIPEPITVELVRPASQGIKDLAPGNNFYSQKMNIRISGLDVNEDNGNLKKVKYCSSCDALADENNPDFKLDICPKCGSESWGNNIHDYLLFSGATSSMRRTEAMMTDRNDERVRAFYNTMKHFKFQYLSSNDDSLQSSDDESTLVYSYMVKNKKFGIEFCENVLLTEVNYGNRDVSNEPVQINENDQISKRGFITCKHCGRVALGENDTSDSGFNSTQNRTSKGTSRAAKFHYPYCHYKDIAYGNSDKSDHEHFYSLYLYRTMNTEAIKILLPFIDDGEEAQALTDIVKAGLELGLKHYYKGSPEHLVIEQYREKNKNTGDFDNYLVIYDSIPGGTGYLAKLFNPSEFTNLLKVCYDKIRNCDCKNHNKDGCYQCILTYSNQWNRKNLSRSRAEKIFSDLLTAIGISKEEYREKSSDEEHLETPKPTYGTKKIKRILPHLKHKLPGNWEKVCKKIGNIIVPPRLEDSQLEVYFVNMMKKIARQNKWGWRKNIDKITNLYSYTLIITENRNSATLEYDNEIVYKIIPQYKDIIVSQAFPRTIPDFQFECTYAKINGNEVDTSSLIHWSVFLDGHAFHAAKENFRFYGDLLRREAVRKSTTSRKSRTWTLFWDDVLNYINDNTTFTDKLAVSPNESLLEYFPNTLYKSRNTVERFLFLLSNPLDIEKECFNFIVSSFTDITDETDEGVYSAPQSKMDEVLEQNLRLIEDDSEADEDENIYVRTNFLDLKNDSLIIDSSLWYCYSDEDINPASAIKYKFKMLPNLEELEKGIWIEFWSRYNIIQMFESDNTELIAMLKEKFVQN